MKHRSVLKEVIQAGASVTQIPRNKKFQAVLGNHVVEWYNQNGDAECVRCREIDDEDNSMIDYYAGFYPRTIKAVGLFLKEAEYDKIALTIKQVLDE